MTDFRRLINTVKLSGKIPKKLVFDYFFLILRKLSFSKRNLFRSPFCRILFLSTWKKFRKFLRPEKKKMLLKIKLRDNTEFRYLSHWGSNLKWSNYLFHILFFGIWQLFFNFHRSIIKAENCFLCAFWL